MSGLLEWQRHQLGNSQDCDLVLIHGWGMNGAVWDSVIPMLSQEYRVHVVDLPGYGHNRDVPCPDNLEQLVEMLLADAPKQAVWLGWSLGGLVAATAAMQAPERVSKLVTLASSPCFQAEKGWRGIKPKVLANFATQLQDDFSGTIQRFMALQAMGSSSAREDIKQLRAAVLSRAEPDANALTQGLEWLAGIDLREALVALRQPWLQLYGRLDGLVPVVVAKQIQRYHPEAEQHVLQASSHAPFITESDAFCQRLYAFV